MSANALPREVLRWLQSLDLSYSVRNVKRDFANGFLIAEILSRYFDGEIQIHSFTNGVAMAGKQDNWFQLRRLFARFNLEFSEESINEIIHCKTGSAADFLEYLFSALTNRKLSKATQPRRDCKVPQFARSTASHAIKQKLKDPDMLLVQDSKLRELSIVQTLEQHKTKRTEERVAYRKAIDESYYSSISESKAMECNSLVQSSVGSQSQPVRPGVPPAVLAKPIHVRQHTRSIALLRAKHDHKGTRSISVQSFGFSQASTGGLAGGPQQVSLLDVFGKIAAARFPGLESRECGGDEEDLLLALVSQIEQGNEAHAQEETLVHCFEEMGAALDDLDGPVETKEFWAISMALTRVLESCSEESNTFEAAREVFAHVGQALLRQVDYYQVFPDKRAVLDMFFDLCLPQLLPMLSKAPEKRRAILTILFGFAEQAPLVRSHMVRRLYDALGNLCAFLQCLTILIFMEDCLTASDHGVALLDLYAYYALIGASQPQPTMRAASLAMLAVVVQHDPHFVPRVLPTLERLAADDWWEVQCQLLIVGAKLLEVVEPGCDVWDQLISLLLRVFRRDTTPNVQKVGLAYLCPHLDANKLLLERFVDVLGDLGDRAECEGARRDEYALDQLLDLHDPEQLPIPSACGGKYQLPPLPLSWKATTIIDEVDRRLAETGLKLWEVQVIHAITVTQRAAPPEPESEEEREEREDLALMESESKLASQESKESKSDLRDEHVLSLSLERFGDAMLGCIESPQFAGFSLPIIRTWAEHPITSQKLLENPALPEAIQKVFQAHEEELGEHQRLVGQLFADLIKSPIAGPAATALISSLCQAFPELLENPALADLEELT